MKYKLIKVDAYFNLKTHAYTLKITRYFVPTFESLPFLVLSNFKKSKIIENYIIYI